MKELIAATHFRFEADFVEAGMRCIPMIVRFKLDRCGIKLQLAEWSRMNELERQHLAESACESEEEVLVYRSWLQMTIYKRTGGMGTSLPMDTSPPWMAREHIPISVQEKLSEIQMTVTQNQWNAFTDLQRFALVKLSRPGHENRNFPLALLEFTEDHAQQG